jgi:hypothetical protein
MGFTAGRLLNLFHLLEFGLAKPPLAVKEARKSCWNNKVAASRKLQELTVALLVIKREHHLGDYSGDPSAAGCSPALPPVVATKN